MKGEMKMGDKVTSRTEQDSNFVERLFDDHHYKTTISDGRHTVEKHGWTAKESEERASDAWDELDDD